MKKCPSCAKEVNDNALFCKYCGYRFNDDEKPMHDEAISKVISFLKEHYIKLIIGVAVLIAAVGIGLIIRNSSKLNTNVNGFENMAENQNSKHGNDDNLTTDVADNGNIYKVNTSDFSKIALNNIKKELTNVNYLNIKEIGTAWGDINRLGSIHKNGIIIVYEVLVQSYENKIPMILCYEFADVNADENGNVLGWEDKGLIGYDAPIPGHKRNMTGFSNAIDFLYDYQAMKEGGMQDDGSSIFYYPNLIQIGSVDIIEDNLRIRSGPSTSTSVMGMTTKWYAYPVYEVINKSDYTWYRIGENQYIASKEGKWTKYHAN